MINKVQIGKIRSICGKVLLWLLILLCALFIILTLSQKQNSDGLAKLLGYSPLSIQSDSMKGDKKENFQTGDLILVKSLSENEVQDLKAGDIISFRDIVDGKRIINTHRIIEIIDKNGLHSFVTKGDNNPVSDEDVRDARDVIAVYKGSKIAGGGKVLDFLNDKWGFFFCLVLPLALFFIWRIIKLITAIGAYKKIQQEDIDEPNTDTDTIAKMLAGANIDPEIIAAAIAQAAGKEKNSTDFSPGDDS